MMDWILVSSLPLEMPQKRRDKNSKREKSMRTEYRREDNDDTRCQQNLGNWKVDWWVVADGVDQKRLETQCQPEASPQMGSGIGGASYVRRRGGVGLKNRKFYWNYGMFTKHFRGWLHSTGKRQAKLVTSLPPQQEENVYSGETKPEKLQTRAHWATPDGKVSHHTTKRRGMEGGQILQRLRIEWWDPTFLPLTASQNAYSLTRTLQAGDQRVFLNRTQLALERSPKHMAWYGLSHRVAQ